MNMKRIIALVLIGLVVSWAVLASAQEKKANNMQFVVEKIRADKKLLIAENMQLTETEAKAFWPIYHQYKDELFLISARTIALVAEYAENYAKMTEDTARNLIDEYMAIESLGQALRQTFLPRLRQALPDVKVFRYYQLENKINVALMYEFAANIPLIKNAE